MNDPILTNGLLSIASVFATGLLGICSFVAKRIVGAFDTLTANDTKKTEHLGVLAAAVQTHATRIESLEDTIVDGRQSKATEAQNEATATMKASLAIITGQHPVVVVSGDEEPAEGPRTVRPLRRSRPQ